jgi:uroporphyrin-III C-methyltransferase/precorrin-2 dehydrogenase/sirohydrochlorin ferrochelatase
MGFLPVFFDVSARPVLLFGAGPQAQAKLHLLRAAGAQVRWFSAGADAEAHESHSSHYAGRIDRRTGEPGDGDIASALAVVSAAGPGIDDRMAARARALGVPVNVVDRLDLSTFIFPAIVNRGDVTVAIGTGGASPVLARRIREQIEAILPARIGEFAALMRRHRDSIVAARKRFAGFSPRRFWERVIDGPIGAAFLAGRTKEAEAGLSRAIAEADSFERHAKGAVHLVGAGPGDADLLTLRALNALQAADVVFYDELIGLDILDRARRDAELVFVGKRKGEPGIGQAEINRRLAQAANAGHQVVRLKGGDPFVFGRGGEELEHLRAAGIPVFVVPGITAALGCAAEAGLPLTLRNVASRLVFVTANTADGAAGADWSGLGDASTTVAVYMGLASAAKVRDGLIAAGRDPDTPAAVLARGTRPDSQSVVRRLRDLATLAASVGQGPALLVIGDVVAHSNIWNAMQHRQIEVAL